VREPALIVALANAQAVRKPTGARVRVFHDALADAPSANDLLAPFLPGAVAPRQLPALRDVHSAVTAVVNALIDGSPAPLGALNAVAARYPADRALEQGPDGMLRVTRRFRRDSALAILIHQAIDELDGLDAGRLRRCSRPECKLVFYDLTRSATRRWHSERPCGLRERQRRHRVRHAADSTSSTRTAARRRSRR
jgi:predicted RNA-binding Zn ribbon-like protein